MKPAETSLRSRKSKVAVTKVEKSDVRGANGSILIAPSVATEGEATNTGILDLILDHISKSTGTDSSEFTDGTAVAEHGVDSIMAMEIVATVKAKSDIELIPSFIFDYPTIADLRREFGGGQSAQSPQQLMTAQRLPTL